MTGILVRLLSLVLICRRYTCNIAAGTAWDTVPTWEQKWPATLLIPVFTPGMLAKLIQVQLRRHAGGRALWWLWLPAAHVLIRSESVPGDTGGYLTDTSAAYENQALLRCYVHKVTFTLYQIAFGVDKVWTATAPNWNKSYTHIEHCTGAVDREGWVLPVPVHNPEHLLLSQWIPVLFCCLFTSAMVQIPVRTTPKCESNPTCYAQLWRSARHSCALLHKSRWNHPFYVWTEVLSGVVFVPVQKLSDIVLTLP